MYLVPCSFYLHNLHRLFVVAVKYHVQVSETSIKMSLSGKMESFTETEIQAKLLPRLQNDLWINPMTEATNKTLISKSISKHGTNYCECMHICYMCILSSGKIW